MKKLVFVFLFIVFGCSSGNERKVEKEIGNPLAETGMNEIDEIELDKINRKIDSALVLYEKAIKAANEGENESEIKQKYEDKVIRFNQEISQLIDSVTAVYIEQNRSQEEYDSFIAKIKLERIQARHEKLAELGVIFDLKKKP